MASWVISKTLGKDSPEYKDILKHNSMIDPKLHAIGVIQSEAHQEVANLIDWQIVFTSPMQRTMMTTINLFCNHPNMKNIKFVVLPIVREILHLDIAMDCQALVERYGAGKPEAKGLEFDFSRLFAYGTPDLWQVHTLNNISKQNMIFSRICEEQGPGDSLN